MESTKARVSLAIGLAASLAAAATSAQPPASRAPAPSSAAPAITTPAPFQLGATRAQAVRACDGTAEDDTRTGVTCSPGGIWAGSDPQPFVVGTLCGARVCRIDIAVVDGMPRATVVGPARAAAARLASLGAGEDGGDDAACATAFFGGSDACLEALPPGRTIWRRWNVPGGGWARVRLRAMTNGMLGYLESYVDARAVAADVPDVDL